MLDIRKEFPLSKVSLIFGCGGNRDKEKRSMMGTIARKYSNNIYLKDDNPRFEDPELIRNEVKKGFKSKKYFEIPSRAKAIVSAVTYYNDPKKLAEVSKDLKDAMEGIDISEIPKEQRLQERGW